jgi:hypothetical protein
MNKDFINSLLPKEFHTANGIPTDPQTHSLFFIGRIKAVMAYFIAFGAGIAVTYSVMHHHPVVFVAVFVFWTITGFWTFD